MKCRLVPRLLTSDQTNDMLSVTLCIVHGFILGFLSVHGAANSQHIHPREQLWLFGLAAWAHSARGRGRLEEGI